MDSQVVPSGLNYTAINTAGTPKQKNTQDGTALCNAGHIPTKNDTLDQQIVPDLPNMITLGSFESAYDNAMTQMTFYNTYFLCCQVEEILRILISNESQIIE